MNSAVTAERPARIVEHGGLLYNKALKRCVDPGRPDARSAHTLFEYDRINDETYRCAHRKAVPRWYAMRWLAGEDIGPLEAQRGRLSALRRRSRMTVPSSGAWR